MNNAEKFQRCSKPIVAIVMPNWNGMNDSMECLNSISDLDYPKHCIEVIVSDNGSTDGSQASISQIMSKMREEGFRRVQLVENHENIGAPAAYNRGIEAVSEEYDYILKIDNDIVFSPECVNSMVALAESRQDIGLVGGCEFADSKLTRVRTIGGYFINYFFKPYYPLANQAYSKKHSARREIEFPTGSCMLIKRSVIEKVGLFDENFFVYWDDFDYAYRSYLAGFSSMYEPEGRFWHKGSSTTGGLKSDFFVFQVTRNRIFFVRKHCSLLHRYIFYVYMIIVSVVRTINFISKSHPMLAIARWKGVIHGIFDNIEKGQ